MVHFKMFEDFVDREEGITLLNVMIGLVIFSLFFLPFLQMEKVKDIRERRDAEEARIELIEDALLKYAARVGGYPAPADPTIPVIGAADSVNHGASIRIDPASPVGGLNATVLAGGFNCNAATPPIEVDGRVGGVLCRDARPGVDREVYIGVLPISELGLNLDNGLDPYGNKYTYIVTKDLVDLALEPDPANRLIGSAGGVANNNRGAVEILNETGGTHAFTAGGGPLGNAVPNSGALHFAVIGHGENGFGAFTSNGVQIPCGTAGDTAGPMEIEHCTNMPNGQDGQVNAFEAADNNNDGFADRRGIDDGISLSLANSFDDVVRGHYSIFQNDWVRYDNDVLVINGDDPLSAMKIGQSFAHAGNSINNVSSRAVGLVDVGDEGNSRSDVLETVRLCYQQDNNWTRRFCYNVSVLSSPDVATTLKCNSTRGLVSVDNLDDGVVQGDSVHHWKAYRDPARYRIRGNCDTDTKILAEQLDGDCSARGSIGFNDDGSLRCRP